MEIKIKTCIVGNSSVGKSSVIRRMVQNRFQDLQKATIGLDYNLIKQTIRGRQVQVQLWDTSGQDKFRSIAKNFFRGSDGVILVFSMIDDSSMDSLDFWLSQLREHLDQAVPIVIFGNKSDLKKQLSFFASRALKKLVNRQQLNLFIGSAKEGTNIKEAYNYLLERSIRYHLTQSPRDSIILSSAPSASRQGLKRRRCCDR